MNRSIYFFYFIIITFFLLSSYDFSQGLIATYKELTPNIFEGYPHPIAIAILKFDGNETIEKDLYTVLKSNPNILNKFIIYSYDVLKQQQNVLGIKNLNDVSNQTLKQLDKGLGIKFILTGNVEPDNKFTLKIIRTIDNSEVYTKTYQITKNSTAINDAVKLFAENKTTIYIDKLTAKFNIKPTNASISIDGNDFANIREINLKPGEHIIKLKADGYEPLLDTINIIGNNDNSFSFNLSKKIPDNMIFVEGGWFNMGNGNSNENERPVHRVFVISFYIDKYEVTQAEYEKVMGNNPSYFKGANLPVENVNWKDANEYARRVGKRLPTEAEWEYAARGGNKSNNYTYSGSNNINEVAWIYNNSGYTLHNVGTKNPNELGIYDMSGNVWEWCSDWYDESYYSISPNHNPQGPSNGTNRIVRGGSWNLYANVCLVTYRSWENPNFHDNNLGFRCVK